MRLQIAAIALAPLLAGADDATLRGFKERTEQYAAVRKAAMGKVGQPPKNAKPEEVDKYEKSLLQAIRDARPNAKQGDIFTPDVRPVFSKILKDHLAGAVNKESRDIAKQGNPKAEKNPEEQQPVLQVNAVYPKSASFSTVPPVLLLQLPKLPMNLEYRFVGNTLILWDNVSSLIVDYMQGASLGL